MTEVEKIEQAKSTLRILVERGENLLELRHVMYFFYGDNLAPIRERLTALGFKTHASADGDYWGIIERHRSIEEAGMDAGSLAETNCVVAERHEVICEEWRTTVLRDLHRLASEYSVDLDGWQASCARDANSDEGGD